MSQLDTDSGYDVVIASSRLPVRCRPLRWHEAAGDDGGVLRAVASSLGAAWIGLSPSGLAGPELLDNVWLHPLALPQDDIEDHLYGHCASTIGPLYYDNGVAPEHRPCWRQAHTRANWATAVRIADVAARDAAVWIHDYHLQMASGFLRRLRRDVRIGFTFRSPFPPLERFTTQPLRAEIMASLRSCDLIAFPDRRSLRNFTDVAEVARLARPGTPANGLPSLAVLGMAANVADIARHALNPETVRRAASIRSSLGDPDTILLSIGAPEHNEASHRLMDAYARLLTERRIDPAAVALVHVAICDDDPTHQRCDRARLDRKIAQINGVHGDVGRLPVHYLHREGDLRDAVALYLAADVLLALPLHDGVTLPVEEYLAARPNGDGRVVLSEFSSTSPNTTGVDVVNPYDIDAVCDAIVRSSSTRQRTPTHSDRTIVPRDAVTWGEQFLARLMAVPRPTPAGATAHRAFDSPAPDRLRRN